MLYYHSVQTTEKVVKGIELFLVVVGVVLLLGGLMANNDQPAPSSSCSRSVSWSRVIAGLGALLILAVIWHG